MRIEVELIRLCPYCRKRTKKRSSTCGSLECQYKHHIKHLRKYWDKYYRKTEQVRSRRIKI